MYIMTLFYLTQSNHTHTTVYKLEDHSSLINMYHLGLNMNTNLQPLLYVAEMGNSLLFISIVSVAHIYFQ